jgi:hypothetical protein
MGPLELSTALRRFVIRQYDQSTEDDGLVPLLLFDEAGSRIDIGAAMASSPTQGRTEAGLEFFGPVPGRGHINVRHRSSDAATGIKTVTYVVCGPDWNATVQISEPRRAAMTITPTIGRMSEGGMRFLARLAD